MNNEDHHYHLLYDENSTVENLLYKEDWLKGEKRHYNDSNYSHIEFGPPFLPVRIPQLNSSFRDHDYHLLYDESSTVENLLKEDWLKGEKRHYNDSNYSHIEFEPPCSPVRIPQLNSFFKGERRHFSGMNLSTFALG